MEERMLKQNKAPTCNVMLENRNKLNVTGVLDVVSFDEETVILETELGALIIKGQDFHINRLNVDIGEIAIEGEIDSAAYEDGFSKPKGGFLSRMFK